MKRLSWWFLRIRIRRNLDFLMLRYCPLRGRDGLYEHHDRCISAWEQRIRTQRSQIRGYPAIRTLCSWNRKKLTFIVILFYFYQILKILKIFKVIKIYIYRFMYLNYVIFIKNGSLVFIRLEETQEEKPESRLKFIHVLHSG